MQFRPVIIVGSLPARRDAKRVEHRPPCLSHLKAARANVAGVIAFKVQLLGALLATTSGPDCRTPARRWRWPHLNAHTRRPSRPQGGGGNRVSRRPERVGLGAGRASRMGAISSVSPRDSCRDATEGRGNGISLLLTPPRTHPPASRTAGFSRPIAPGVRAWQARRSQLGPPGLFGNTPMTGALP